MTGFINMKHELVVLADRIDWAWLDAQLAESFSDQGRPAEPVRFMIGMFLLKHTYALSDEQVWDGWVHDPYFQYFTGEEFFQHVLPHERSGMSHWRKRIGDHLDILLQESVCQRCPGQRPYEFSHHARQAFSTRQCGPGHSASCTG